MNDEALANELHALTLAILILSLKTRSNVPSCPKPNDHQFALVFHGFTVRAPSSKRRKTVNRHTFSINRTTSYDGLLTLMLPTVDYSQASLAIHRPRLWREQLEYALRHLSSFECQVMLVCPPC